MTLTEGASPSIVFGAAPLNYDKEIPGLTPFSVGYSTADGTLFHGTQTPKDFGEPCKTGDVVGNIKYVYSILHLH
jgi:hypothetical protein